MDSSDVHRARRKLDEARAERRELQQRMSPYDPEQWRELRELREAEREAELHLIGLLNARRSDMLGALLRRVAD